MLHSVQSLARRQLTCLGYILNEYASSGSVGTSGLTACTLRLVRKLSNTRSIPKSIESVRYQLMTACSGVSKEEFSKKTPNIAQGVMSNKVGDDSWFITSHKTCDVVGIADGVGGWRDVGVDPSKFSTSLMHQCKRIIDQDTNLFSNSQNINETTPLKILKSSYECLVESKDPNLVGSSTACILVFNRETRKIYTANLGDSGFAIIRNNQIVHRSQEQFHYFNCPFQLSLVPENSDRNLVLDKPERAAMSSFELVEGDLIVLATDGLWDNLSEGLLLLKLAKIESQSDLDKASKNIVDNAFEISKNPFYLSPFSSSARRNGINYIGGKPDDITVLLARVCKSQ